MSNAEYDNLVKKAGNQDANDPATRWNDLVSAAKIVNRNQAITPIYQQTTAYLQKATCSWHYSQYCWYAMVIQVCLCEVENIYN